VADDWARINIDGGSASHLDIASDPRAIGGASDIGVGKEAPFDTGA